MTDKDIIKALECCGKNHILGKMSECKNCYLQNNTLCITDLIYQTLDLINRQKAEIERLRDGNRKCIYLSDEETTEYCVEAICPQFKTEAQTRAEAITKFAERLCKDRVSNDPVVIAVKTELKMMKEGANNG